jgi:O-antigen ligase
MSTKTVVLLFLPFLPVLAYLAIKYPAYAFMFFFCAASLEGGFVSEVRTITVTRLCFLLLVIAFSIYMVTEVRWRKYDSTVLIIIGGFFLYYFLSYFWAPNQISASNKVLRISAYLVVCIIGYNLFKNASLTEYKHFIALYISCVIILIAHLYLQMDDFVRIGELSGRTSQRVFPFNPNSFGRSLVVALTMVISLCFCARKKLVWLFLSLLFVGTCLPLVMISGSRSSLLVLVVVCLLMGSSYLYCREKGSTLRVLGVLGTCLFCAVAVFVFSKEWLPANLSHRIGKLVYHPLAVITENIRVVFFEQGLMLAQSSPIFGLGMRGYESVMQYPHNVLVEVLIESGVIGLVCFLLVLVALLVRFRDLLRYSRDCLPEWHAVVFVMVFSVASSWMFALLVGELSDHRVSYFLLSILLGLDHRIRTATIA